MSTLLKLLQLGLLLTLTRMVQSKTCAKGQPILKTNAVKSSGAYVIPYGSDILVNCSADMPKIMINGHKVHKLTSLNSTTIQALVLKPDVSEGRYICEDTTNDCTNIINIKVQPVIVVVSPKPVHRKGNTYFLPHGESLELFCSGQNASNLKFRAYFTNYRWYSRYPPRYPSEILNSTTIKARVEPTKLSYSKGFVCTDLKRARAYDNEIVVLGDAYPSGGYFRCVYDFGRNVECLWRSSSDMNIYKLYYSARHYTNIRDPDWNVLCTATSTTYTSCSSSDFMINFPDHGQKVIFLLQSCNKVFCNNQTFTYNLTSITKLEAVPGMKLVNTSSYGAVVAWQRTYELFRPILMVEYKVEYKMIGMDWRHVVVPEDQCTYKCEIELSLPCPGYHHEAKVYIKLKESNYWSAPTDSLYFFTDSDVGGVKNPECTKALQEPEPVSTVETVLREVDNLIRYMIKRKLALKESLNILKRKRNTAGKIAKIIREP